MQGNLFSRVDIYSVPVNLQCNKEKRQSGAVIEGTFHYRMQTGINGYMTLLNTRVNI